MTDNKIPDDEYIDNVGVLKEHLALVENASKELTLTHREPFSVKKFHSFSQALYHSTD